MKNAETVTFGATCFDRAAHLRSDDAVIKKMSKDPRAGALPIWRGKPLFSGSDEPSLCWLSPAHDIFALAEEDPVFLGVDDDRPFFAFDISGWEPAVLPDTLGAFLDPSEQVHPSLPDGARFAELRGQLGRLTERDADFSAISRSILGWHQTHGFCARCGAKTNVAMAGWQRNCPACDSHHFPRTDPVVIMLVTHGNRVLIGRSPGWPERMYSLLAGFVEPGETIEAAVRREVYEEANITVGPVEYLASQPWPFPSSLMVGCKAKALTCDITIDPTELESAIWVTREDMMDIFAGNNESVLPARKGAIAQFLLSNWLADTLD